MNNYRLQIQYDGTRYHGWQKQKNNTNTIQEKIECVLTRIYQEPVAIQGAGRTDAGVHAKSQIANFFLKEEAEPSKILADLNEYLPEDIRILQVSQAGPRFHSRLNATGKIYEYHLIKKGCYNVFDRKYSWQMTEDMNLEQIRIAAEQLEGEHDFRGFCSKASKKKSTIRKISRIEIEETEQSVFLRFEGNGFLYNMVRILTGTLVEIGTGRKSPEVITEIFNTGERALAGETAPAKGLMLLQVKYD